MNSRFPKAVMESIRNRELLAQALQEQEQELVRRRRIVRALCVGVPLAGIYYVMHGPPLMEMEGLKSLSNLQKSIFKQAAAQAQAGGKMMIGEEKKAQEAVATNAYTQTESVDDMVQELEARNAKLQDFADKHKSNFSQEQLMGMVEKANQNQTGAPSTRDLENLASDLQERSAALDEALGEGIKETGNIEKPTGGAEQTIGQEKTQTPETRTLASTTTTPTCSPLSLVNLRLALPELGSISTPQPLAYQATTESELIRIALLAPTPVKSPSFHEYVPVNKIDF